MQDANYQYRLPVLPPDAPFEIRPSAGKGLGAFATRDIEAASRVLLEEPLMVICKPDYEISDVDVETAFSRLNPGERSQFLSMGVSENRSFVSTFDTFMRNKFEVRRAPNEKPDGQGMYLLCPRINHSCVPNAAVMYSPPRRSTYAHAVYALKPIAQGEEITINYNPNSYYHTYEMRHRAGTWDFTCDCPACNVSDPFHYVSDMRRILLRGLFYLMNGVDVAGCEGRKVPVTREGEKEKISTMQRSSLTFKDLENIVKWSVLSGYLAEVEGIAMMASAYFKNAMAVTLELYDESPAVGMREAYRRDAYRWASKSLDAIKSCRPADHSDVKDREKLLPLLSEFFLSRASVNIHTENSTRNSTEWR